MQLAGGPVRNGRMTPKATPTSNGSPTEQVATERAAGRLLPECEMVARGRKPQPRRGGPKPAAGRRRDAVLIM